jgi:phosphoenolpyruvate carboxykinase (GTP)
MASERTAAQYGKLGEVRRDPMAMLPFCGYNMADYFQHWLNMGQKITAPPLIFHVNWFRTDDNGDFLWPGYGENIRVLEWITKRCAEKGSAQKTPIGYIPDDGALDLTGLDLPDGVLQELLRVDPKDWLNELEGQKEFFAKFDQSRLPAEIKDEFDALAKRLKQ